MKRSLFILLLVECAAVDAQKAALYLESGDSKGAKSAFVSPDNRFVLTHSVGPALLWDVATGAEVRRFDATSPPLAALSPDGRLVVTGDGPLHLWDVKTGAATRTLPDALYVSAVAFSSDSRWLLTGASGSSLLDQPVQLWDVQTGALIRTFYGLPGYAVEWVGFSKDRRFVAAIGGTTTEIHVWSTATGVPVSTIKGSGKLTYACAISPDGRSLLLSTEKGTVLWNRLTQTEIRQLVGPSEFARAVSFSPDGRFLLTGHADKSARLWDVKTGSEVRRFVGDSATIEQVGFSPDGRLVFTAGDSVRLWNAETGDMLQRFGRTLNRIACLAFAPDGQSVVTCDGGKEPRVWELGTGSSSRSYRGHSDSVGSAVFSRDGRFLLTGSGDGTARLWDTGTGMEARQFPGHTKGVRDVALSPDAHFALTSSGDDIVRLWNADTGTEVRRFEVRTQGVEPDKGKPRLMSFAISPDARYFATASSDKILRLFDAATGALAGQFNDFAYFLVSIAISPDGTHLLAAAGEQNARIFNLKTSKEVTELFGAWGYAAPTFSPDGRYVLSSLRNSAELSDAATDKTVQILEGHSGEVSHLAFSPDGRWIASASDDSTVRLWETATGKWLATLLSFGDDWLVVDPAGRFDTSNLDGGAPLHWAISDNPLRPLPLEIFMRDYYTPRLLPLILNGDPLPPLPRIEDIRNRMQPDVSIERVEVSAGNPNHADVYVRASSKTEKERSSGLQDLRVFRNGQLVAYREGSLNDGEYVFPNIPLPLSAHSALFTAYAFNSVRIKSPTTLRELIYTPQGDSKPRAFLVQVGVNHYHASNCDLRYAVNDARKLHSVLEPRLIARGFAVRSVELVSMDALSEGGATKERIRETLAAVAAEATPDDAVFLSFSGHGYAAKDGQFYLFPSDILGSCGTAGGDLLQSAISADELAGWLRKIDAGEMTFILDSCYSAQSVQANGFKPGPMGSRGLGQLAYDKRIRILAASQSDVQAIEDSRLAQGLLSYALAEAGLVQGKADWKPKDQQITVGEWLAYGAAAVPKLENSRKAGGQGRGVLVEENTLGQIPALFDFSKTDRFVIQ